MSQDEMDELKRQISEIHKALLGDFENQGIVSRLRKLEDRAANFNRFSIILGTGMLGLVLNLIRELLIK